MKSSTYDNDNGTQKGNQSEEKSTDAQIQDKITENIVQIENTEVTQEDELNLIDNMKDMPLEKKTYGNIDDNLQFTYELNRQLLIFQQMTTL